MYLKDNHLGRATFFPIEVIKERKIDDSLINRIQYLEGFIDVLLNKVEYKEGEIAVSFTREMDEISRVGVKAPPHSTVERFEREVLAKVSSMRRYAASRHGWLERLQAVNQQVANLPASVQIPLRGTLDSARAGSTALPAMSTPVAGMPRAPR